MLRAYVQVRDDGMPFNANAYAAYDGFRERGVATDSFRSDDPAFWSSLLEQKDDLVFAAGIGTVHRILDTWGVARPPSLDYPASLAPFYGRRVWRTTLGEIRDATSPLFVKSIAAKGVNGHVVSDFGGLLQTAGLDDDTPVYASEPIGFLAEWRVFVLDGEILGIRLYKGSPFLAPDEATAREMVGVLAGSGEAPTAFGLDVGRVEGGETRVVEVNEGYSLGTYGLAPPLVARMLEGRWAEFRSQRGSYDSAGSKSRLLELMQ